MQETIHDRRQPPRWSTGPAMDDAGAAIGSPAAPARYATTESELGWVAVAGGTPGIDGIALGDTAAAALGALQIADRQTTPANGNARAMLQAYADTLADFIARPEIGLPALPLTSAGTVFQNRVWRALRAIAPGQTATYAQIANQIGTPTAARAVAGACAANRWALAVPCHRVIRAGGGLGGYRWGIERKQALLARERAVPTRR